jgi:hypothetical protein
MSRRCTTVTCCLAITAVALITPSFSSQSVTPVRRLASDANSAQKVDPIVEAGRRELKLPSVSIAVMLGHKLVLAKGYGEADHKAGLQQRSVRSTPSDPSRSNSQRPQS